MEEHIADKAWVVQFEKPKGNPAALEPATTVLSPYLKFGCLSVRVFYKRLQEVRLLPLMAKLPRSTSCRTESVLSQSFNIVMTGHKS